MSLLPISVQYAGNSNLPTSVVLTFVRIVVGKMTEQKMIQQLWGLMIYGSQNTRNVMNTIFRKTLSIDGIKTTILK